MVGAGAQADENDATGLARSLQPIESFTDFGEARFEERESLSAPGTVTQAGEIETQDSMACRRKRSR
jgi:hypothetical protein